MASVMFGPSQRSRDPVYMQCNIGRKHQSSVYDQYLILLTRRVGDLRVVYNWRIT